MQSPITAFDWALRGGAFALLLLIAAILLRDRRAVLNARVAAAFAIGTAAYVLYFAPGFARPGAAWQLPIFALSAGNMVVLWLFASAVFDDDFRLQPGHLVAWAIVVVIAVVVGLAAGHEPPIARRIGYVLDAAGVLFALLAIARAIASWRADLVEVRRNLRLFVVVGGGIYAVVATGSRFDTRPGTVAGWTSLLDTLALTLLVVVAAWRLLQVMPRSDLIVPLGPVDTAGGAPAPKPLRPGPVEAPRADAAEQALAGRVIAEMTVERAYRRENLTIGALAGHLRLQEYRLRRLINQRLGYRNFNAFLNHYRIEAAKQVLADPARTNVPVLTIALDVGFQSIGPFNRAFKEATGLTPTEFRRREAGAAPESLADSEKNA